MASASVTVVRRSARAWVTHSARFGLFLVVTCLVAMVVLLLTGHRTIVVLSGSMSPAIETSDVVISRTVPPTEVKLGDVVTFSDPEGGQRLITHRVEKIIDKGSLLKFVTKGDANETVERWGIKRDGTVGRTWFTIPNAGWILGRVAQPWVLAGLATLCLLAAMVVGLRRIWRS